MVQKKYFKILIDSVYSAKKGHTKQKKENCNAIDCCFKPRHQGLTLKNKYTFRVTFKIISQ